MTVTNQLKNAIDRASGNKMLRNDFEDELEYQKENGYPLSEEACAEMIENRFNDHTC